MATKRRKGEQRVIHEPIVWSEDCIIAGMIASGDRWFYAWFVQQSVPTRTLSRLSGVSIERISELERCYDVSDDELAALASPLRTDAASLRASLNYDRECRERRGHAL